MKDKSLHPLRTEAAELASALKTLVFYRDLQDFSCFRCYIELLDAYAEDQTETFSRRYAAWNRALIEESEEASWPYWLAGRILMSVNPVSRGFAEDTLWHDALRRELAALKEALEKGGSYWAGLLHERTPEKHFPLYDRGMKPLKITEEGFCSAFLNMQERLLGEDPPSIEELLIFHRRNGFGLTAKYRALLHRPEGLCGIERLDPVLPDDLFDYSGNLDKLKENTENLLAGKEAAHVLLYGTRGCGKSSAVKAMVNAYEKEGLRLIEINPRHLEGLAEIMAKTEHSSLYYILFIDDLSFRSTDTEYTELKSFLQGGAMDIPSNCRLYVTSNRRHLVPEMMDESRQEIYENDGIDERVSLSDRFGLKLHFLAPLQREYLDLVHFLAVEAGLSLPDPALDREALAFALKQGHRSPREASLFIRHYLNKQEKNEGAPS